jgi:hypothetical protein
MGTWGDGVFDNDTAMDISDAWEALEADDLTPDQKEALIRQDPAIAFYFADYDDRPLAEAAVEALKAGRCPEFGHEGMDEPAAGPPPSQEWRDNRRRITEDLNRRTPELLRRMREQLEGGEE